MEHDEILRRSIERLKPGAAIAYTGESARPSLTPLTEAEEIIAEEVLSQVMGEVRSSTPEQSAARQDRIRSALVWAAGLEELAPEA